MLLDAEQAGQPQRGEQRVAGLGLGDQEAHRDRAVDVLDDLRDRHHQLRGRGLLGDQRAEIDRFGLDRVQRGVDRGEQRAAVGRILRRVGDAQPLADDVVELRRVQPRMGVRQRHAVRDQPGAGDGQREFLVILGLGDGGAKQRQQRRGRGQRGFPLPTRACAKAATLAGSG